MKNWKTTVAGVVAGLAQAYAGGGFTGDWQSWIPAIATIILGALAKDAGITGTQK